MRVLHVVAETPLSFLQHLKDITFIERKPLKYVTTRFHVFNARNLDWCPFSDQILLRATSLLDSNSGTDSNWRILLPPKSSRLCYACSNLRQRLPTPARTFRNWNGYRAESSLPSRLFGCKFSDGTCFREVLECRNYEWNLESVGYVSQDVGIWGYRDGELCDDSQ